MVVRFAGKTNKLDLLVFSKRLKYLIPLLLVALPAFVGCAPQMEVTLQSAGNGSTVSSLQPILAWGCDEPDARYRLQVASDGGFQNLIIDASDLSGPSYIIPSDKLTDSQTYYWRVKASKAGHTSSWSTVWAFQTPTGPGTISVQATLDGSPWAGAVSYTMHGPDEQASYSSIPESFSNMPAGTYILTYSSGGLEGATLSSISPTSTQTLSPGGTITFTLNFHSQPAGKVETKMVHVGDIDIAYKMFGEGEPLLLIMGYSGTMDLWPPEVLQELATHYKVIIFDNRGMGETTASDKQFTIELFADDTAGLLDALNIEHAHVLGWSMGTTIAQQLALDHPDKVGKLILYAAYCGGKEAIWPSREVLIMLVDTSGTPEERGERLLKLLFPQEWLEEHPDPSTYFPMPTETSSPENVARQYEAMGIWYGTFSRLPQITQDTLLITGTDDILTPPENSFIIAQQIPGAWLVQLKGGGHGVMYQYSEKFSRIVLTFLEN